MRPSTEAPVIIIKRVKKGVNKNHSSSWKVAYADFVTALMALFIVLWVLAQQDKAKAAVSLYFTEPNLTAEQIKLRLEHPALPHSRVLHELSRNKVALYSSFNDEHRKLSELAEKIKARLQALKWYKSMKGQLLIELTEEGLRIEFLDRSNAPFFDVGSAIPRPYTTEALKNIAEEIAKMPNPVAIEGHTDSRPFLNKGYGNWELSADRANSARCILESSGCSRIAEVRGLANVHLRDSEHPYNEENRRVALIVRHLVQKPTLSESPAPEGTSTPVIMAAPPGASTSKEH